MNFLNNIRVLTVLIFLAILCGCKKHFVDAGPQPIFFDELVHEPKLNVFGVLRVDNTQGYSNSFIHLENVIEATGNEDVSVVEDALVQLIKTDDAGGEDIIDLIYTNYDLVFLFEDYRPENANFNELESYELKCIVNEFPILTGNTIIPPVPQIYNDLIIINDDEVQFDIITNIYTGLYEILIITENETISTKIVNEGSEMIHFSSRFNSLNQTTVKITVIAYDTNLSEYLQFNLSINPNTYQPSYTTVNNGYGCFGSLNMLSKEVII